MKTWRRLGLFLVLSAVGTCVVGLGQISITLPGTQQGAYTGNAIDFGDVAVGTTKTATYTFSISAASSTAGTVTFIGFSGGFFERPPFAMTDLPSLPRTIPAGGSITFHVTFAPTAARVYSDAFTITVSGGWPATTKTQTVALTGRGVTGDISGTDTSGQYDFTRLQTTIDATRQDIARLEAKLDRLPGQLPGEDVAKLEVKLDELYSQLTEWYVALQVDVGKIWIAVSQLGACDLTDMETAIDTLETKFDGLQPTLDDIEMDLSMLVDGVRDLDSGSAQNAANAITVEAKLDALDARLGDISAQLDRLSANAQRESDGELETKLDAQEIKLDGLQSALTAMQAQIRANSTAIAALQASNSRIEEMLNRLLAGSESQATAPAPDASKITAILEKVPANGGPADCRIAVTGSAGAALPSTLVNVYLKPGDQPFPRGVGPDGSFSATLANPRPVDFIEVTQVVDASESAPVRIELSSGQQAEAPPPPDASKITLSETERMDMASGSSSTLGGTLLPSVHFDAYAEVRGIADAVQPYALVTAYWPDNAPPLTTTTADENGAFLLDKEVTRGARSIPYVEVTQTVSGQESAPVRIELSPDERAKAPPPPDAATITMSSRTTEKRRTSIWGGGFWVVTAVTAEAGAAEAGSLVTCYSDEVDPPRSATATADAEGGFHLELGTALVYPGSFELTQTVDGMESERVVVWNHQLLAMYPMPDASRIRLSARCGPVPVGQLSDPSDPWSFSVGYVNRCSASIRGDAGAVFPESLVTVYWPTADPPSITVADATGGFDLSREIGELDGSTEYGSTITFVEVTQTVGQEEGERVRIPVSLPEG